jgi:Rrf2 family protein
MRVTKWGEYGILCSLCLAEKHGQKAAVGAAEIAEARRIPIQYTQQILHRLRKGGIVKSTRGPHGGFKLSKSPAETTLRDILCAAEGDTFEIICESRSSGANACSRRSFCGLKFVWQDLRSAINQVLEERTLATILKLQAGSGAKAFCSCDE